MLITEFAGPVTLTGEIKGIVLRQKIRCESLVESLRGSHLMCLLWLKR